MLTRNSIAIASSSVLRAITITALSAATVIVASQAHASTITYDFTVNVTKGSLTGKLFSGFFSYDDSILKGAGVEELGVSQKLTVCMNYFGRNYNETDDRDHPAFPKLIFENGKIKQLDFWVQPNKRSIWWNIPGWEVKLSMRKNSPTAVPNCQKR